MASGRMLPPRLGAADGAKSVGFIRFLPALSRLSGLVVFSFGICEDVGCLGFGDMEERSDFLICFWPGREETGGGAAVSLGPAISVGFIRFLPALSRLSRPVVFSFGICVDLGCLGFGGLE